MKFSTILSVNNNFNFNYSCSFLSNCYFTGKHYFFNIASRFHFNLSVFTERKAVSSLFVDFDTKFLMTKPTEGKLLMR